MAEGRAAMRRKMRNVLRRHIACVYVSALEEAAAKRQPKRNPIQPISVEKRDAIALLSRSDALLGHQATLRCNAALFTIAVQRFGHDVPEQEFLMAMRSFELPEGVDWEVILLPPCGDETSDEIEDDGHEESTEPGGGPGQSTGGTAGPAAASPEGSLGPAAPTAAVGLPANASPVYPSESACGHGEHTGYQPHSDESRPWGVHICAGDLDGRANKTRSLLAAEYPGEDLSDQADHLAFGVLLSSLEFYARVDLWLKSVLVSAFDADRYKGLHFACFQDLRPLTSAEFRWIGGGMFFIPAQVRKWACDEVKLSKLFEATVKCGPELRTALNMASHLEGMQWANAAQGRSVRSPNLAALAWQVVMTNPSESEGALQALGLHFKSDSAWLWLAERISLVLESQTGRNDGPLDAPALRAALQAHSFDPQGPRPSPIYLHGDGRVVRKLRRALGL